MRISALTVRDFKGIKAISLDADRELILIGGKNGAGKSSALDALTCLLTGEKAIPAEPIRRGESEAEIVAKIDGYVVARRFKRNEAGDVSTTLTITSSDGAKFPSPQGWLNARLAALGCDPVAFLQAKPAEQAATLRTIAGVDTTTIDMARKAAFDSRTETGRVGATEKGALDRMPSHPGAPEAPVDAAIVSPVLVTAPVQSAADIVAELDRATATQRARESADRVADIKAAAHVRAEADAAELFAKIEAARIALAKMERDAAEATEAATLAERAATEAATVAVMVQVTDPAPIRARLAAVEETNATAAKEAAAINAAAVQGANEANAIARKLADDINAQVRANAAHKAQAEKVAATRTAYAAKTREIEAHDAARVALLAAAKFPIEGLSFNEDGVVTFDGIPLSQQNEATRIKVAMAISLAGDKPLKLVLIRNGSQLDEDSMQQVCDIAHEAGAQLWIERVGTKDEGAVIIRDGGVVS